MIGVVLVCATMLIARFLLAPREPSERLLPFTDRPARTLYWFAVVVSVIYAIDIALVTLLRGGGASDATIDLMAIPPMVLAIAFAV